MIVKSRAMKKLCEYEGRPLPDDYKSDCWNDVDETEYACQVNSFFLHKLDLIVIFFNTGIVSYPIVL